MDRDAIRQSLEETYRGNRTLLAGLQDSDLERTTSNPKWRVRQLAGHVAEDDGGALYIGKLLARGKNARAPDFVANLLNWWSVRKYRKAHGADLAPVLDRKHRELMSWFDGLSPEALDQSGTVSQMGHLTLSDFLVRNCAHSREHAVEIQAALAR